MWVLLAIALPLARFRIHPLAIAAAKRDPQAKTSRMLQSANSAVTSVSRRAKF